LNEKSPLTNRPTTAAAGTGMNGMLTIDSAALFEENAVVLIEHNGAIYTLRKTRKGKLILTK
jgi:hemin uptake protein HemP